MKLQKVTIFMIDSNLSQTLVPGSLLRKLLHKLDVDRPVFFGLLSKIWGMAAGPVTALLLAKYFSPVLQGYYYTFSTLLALQVFVELGLGTVIVQFASHEWSSLSLDSNSRICGDEKAFSRLASLAQLALKWYLIGAIIVVVGLGIGGYLFFINSPNQNISWEFPWFVLCLLTGVTVCLVPVWSLLEGCNQVSLLYTFRFYQGLCNSLSVWIAIVIGLKLWVAAIPSMVGIIVAMIFISKCYPLFFKSLLQHKNTSGDSIEWRRDILPMQWKIALSWVSGYFVFSLFTPVLFKFHGPVIAGQFGMTWTIVGAVGGISGAWLAPKVPQFGMLIAKRDFEALDKLFWRVTGILSMVTIVLSVSCWSLVYLLNIFYPSLAHRLLAPMPVSILLAAQAILYFSLPFSSYLRAHKQEPLLVISVISGVLTGISTVLLGKYYSATGMAIGYLTVNIIILPFVILIWSRCRKAWHQ